MKKIAMQEYCRQLNLEATPGDLHPQAAAATQDSSSGCRRCGILREKMPEGKEICNQREIDFIATLGSKKFFIQSAYVIPDVEKYEQETISFDKTAASFKKIIIVEKARNFAVMKKEM